MARASVETTFCPEDPLAGEVRAVLEAHLALARASTPPGHVHALDLEGLLDPALTLFGVRAGGVLVAVGALRELKPGHGEVKSMHVIAAERGRGTGRRLLEHLLAVARERGYERVSLETGTGPAFAAARALYERAGFVRCDPFAAYTDNPYSVCMTLSLRTTGE